jgi:hypothetical protein
MLVLIAIQLMLVAQAVPGADAAPLPALSCEPRPPSPARITGRIVSRDRTAQPNIQVRATAPETDTEYTTVSDEEGRYALTGFDADFEVALEFRDSAKRLATGCSVVPTRSAPALIVDVVLDGFRAGEADWEYGCSHTDWKGSWATYNETRILSPEEFPGKPHPSKAEPMASLDLRAADIAEVIVTEEGAQLRLTPRGTESLRLFTDANIGRMSATTIVGEPAGRATVQGTISSGTMLVPDRYLRGRRLCHILAAMPRRQ